MCRSKGKVKTIVTSQYNFSKFTGVFQIDLSRDLEVVEENENSVPS
jgi:hypothetical protein